MNPKWLGLILGAIPPLCAQPDSALLERLTRQFRPAPRTFAFAAIGDQQYGEEGERKWPGLVASIHAHARELKFVVHVGDMKSGSSPCSDAVFEDRLRSFNQFRIPFILTPGDNEWTDCHRPAAGGFDSLERLARLRQMFFAGDASLGRKKLRLGRQSSDPRYTQYRENALWAEGGFVFATLHIVGSNNNLGRNPANDAEYEERNAATLEWMRTAFALARRNRFLGVVLMFQADPLFPLTGGARAATTSGFVDTLRTLEREALDFGGPVLVIHGDTHYFRFDKPLARSQGAGVVDNVFRLEVPGEADVHWVRVEVDPRTPDSPFRIQHMTVLAKPLRGTIR
jgi:hypothetical protein